MDISYDHYRVFYYAAQLGSFTAAARALGSNQPNVTRTIKKLESELGCPLLLRQSRGVTLTPEGELLYRHLSVAMEYIAAGEAELEKRRGLETGTVTIAASEIALHCVLLPRLKSFRRQYPHVRIRVLNHSTPQAIAAVENTLADFAVVTAPQGFVKSLKVTKLRDIQEVPVCSRAFSELEGRALTLKQLSEYPIISLGAGTNSFSFFAAQFATAGVPFAPDVEASTADQILPLVQSDLGVGFVPMDFLTGTEDVLKLRLSPPLDRREIHLLKRPDGAMSLAAKALEELILSET